MKKQKLIESLINLGVKTKHYTLDNEPFKDSSLVLERTTNHAKDMEYDEWRVFRLERGERFEEKIFYSEDQACLYMFEKLKHQQDIIRKYNLKD